MFFDRLCEACAIQGTSPSAAALKIKRSKSNVTGWRKGQIPSSNTLTALAEFLRTPTDFLLERPPFDQWFNICNDRRGFFGSLDPNTLDIVQLAYNIDPAHPEEAEQANIIDFLKECVEKAVKDDSGWHITLKGPLAAQKESPALTPKDERDIARNLEQIMDQLDAGGDLMFDGDPMSDEARESIRSAVKLGLEAAKLKN